MAVIVRDSGIGISEAHLSRVRDRFFQVDALNGGTGLGLAISQQIVELHQGKLEMDSELGKGTQVTAILPLTDERPPAREQQQPHSVDDYEF
ncbi:Alkaline phosphatase synthesis sensor protein PhoR [compost metagenome]